MVRFLFKHNLLKIMFLYGVDTLLYGNIAQLVRVHPW